MSKFQTKGLKGRGAGGEGKPIIRLSRFSFLTLLFNKLNQVHSIFVVIFDFCICYSDIATMNNKSYAKLGFDSFLLTIH
jgi:hypothetical protein